MPNIFNPTDLAFNGEEIKALNETSFEEVFEKPSLTLFHNIVGGIKATKQIAILGKIEELTGKGSGGCNPADDVIKIKMTEKKWDPKTVSNSIPSCWEDLMGMFWIYGTANGLKKADLTRTDYFNFVQERMVDALEEEVLRIAWFSDVDAADVDATPAGVLTSGTDPLYFNKINGFWKQLFAIVAADSNRRTLGFDTKNAAGSYLAQEFDATDTNNRVATTTLQNMGFEADFRLRGKGDKVIVCTQSIMDQYERELIAAKLPFETEALENGIQTLKIGGTTLIGFQFWDRIIRKWYDNGTTYFLPHRAVMLTKNNTQIGTEEEANFTQFNSFYDEKSEVNYMRTKYNIDAKTILDYDNQTAY